MNHSLLEADRMISGALRFVRSFWSTTTSVLKVALMIRCAVGGPAVLLRHQFATNAWMMVLIMAF